MYPTCFLSLLGLSRVTSPKTKDVYETAQELLSEYCFGRVLYVGEEDHTEIENRQERREKDWQESQEVAGVHSMTLEKAREKV